MQILQFDWRYLQGPKRRVFADLIAGNGNITAACALLCWWILNWCEYIWVVQVFFKVSYLWLMWVYLTVNGLRLNLRLSEIWRHTSYRDSKIEFGFNVINITVHRRFLKTLYYILVLTFCSSHQNHLLHTIINSFSTQILMLFLKHCEISGYNNSVHLSHTIECLLSYNFLNKHPLSHAQGHSSRNIPPSDKYWTSSRELHSPTLFSERPGKSTGIRHSPARNDELRPSHLNQSRASMTTFAEIQFPKLCARLPRCTNPQTHYSAAKVGDPLFSGRLLWSISRPVANPI